MKLFITGATGYIGNRLAMQAAERGWSVHALVRNIESKYCPLHPNVSLFKGDITDPDSINKAISGCDQVFHSAAFTDETLRSNPDFFNVNVKGTENVLEIALKNNVSRFVFTGSCSVFAPSKLKPVDGSSEDEINPTTDYSISKYKAERIVREYSQKRDIDCDR